MNEEYKKLAAHYDDLQNTVRQVDAIIDLLKDSDTLNNETKAKAAAFLEGYIKGLKEQIEWLNLIMP